MERVGFYLGKKKIYTEAKKVRGINKGIGLIFRTKNTNNLLFEFKTMSKVAITSVFVFFPFLAIWLDSKKKVVDVNVVRPFTLSILPKKEAKYLLEIPNNLKNLKLLNSILKFYK